MPFLIQFAWLLLATSPAPLSKVQLIELAQKKVDTELIVELITRDCIDFTVDATVVLELSGVVPKPAIEAAIRCTADSRSLKSATSPPGTSAVTEEIALSDLPPLTLKKIKRISIIPLILDGTPDEALTSAFVSQMRQRKPAYETVDEVQLKIHFENTGAFHSNAPFKSLLAAARAERVDAILIGTGYSYRAFDDFAIRLDVKLLEVNRGKVLWTGGARGKSGLYSWQACKKHTARNVVKKMP